MSTSRCVGITRCTIGLIKDIEYVKRSGNYTHLIFEPNIHSAIVGQCNRIRVIQKNAIRRFNDDAPTQAGFMCSIDAAVDHIAWDGLQEFASILANLRLSRLVGVIEKQIQVLTSP